MTEFLTKQQASNYLTNVRGLPVSVKLLSKLITTGDGPKYQKFGNRVVYRATELDIWVESRLSEQYTSSSYEVK